MSYITSPTFAAYSGTGKIVSICKLGTIPELAEDYMTLESDKITFITKTRNNVKTTTITPNTIKDLKRDVMFLYSITVFISGLAMLSSFTLAFNVYR
jgi:hypothetical protein